MTDETARPTSINQTGVVFGLGMAIAGLFVGYTISQTRSSNPSESEISARVDAAVQARLAEGKDSGGKVVNNTGGELRRLSDDEKKELLSKKARGDQPEPTIPVDSPYFTDAIKGSFGDPGSLAEYQDAVTSMAAGNARKARPVLQALWDKSTGQSWRDPVGALLIDARVSVGEVEDGRALLGAWRQEFPKSKFSGLAMVAEGKAAMKEGKRLASGKDGAAPSSQELRVYDDALRLLDRAIKEFPGDPALADGLLNKAALLAELKRLDEAEAAASALASQFPRAAEAPRALFNVAKVAFDGEDFPRAERLYDRLIKDFPTDRLAQSARNNLSSLTLLGKPGPELEVEEWIGGDARTLASLKGKPVLLVFWATWCPHCRKAMPDIEALWQKHRDQGLQVIAVTKHGRGQDSQKVREYLDENKYSMPVAVDPGATSRDYGVSGIPAAALIDRQGNVVWRNHPAQVTEELLKKVL